MQINFDLQWLGLGLDIQIFRYAKSPDIIENDHTKRSFEDSFTMIRILCQGYKIKQNAELWSLNIFDIREFIL